MDFICRVCDRSLIKNPSEYQHYLATSRMKNDKKLYIKHTINNTNLDELDKILNDYMTTHNEKIDSYLFSCKLAIKVDNNFTENIETSYFYNADFFNTKRNFLFNIYHFIRRAYKACSVCNIKQTILKTVNDRCNMTYKYYMNLPMSMVERRIFINIAKNPSFLNS